MLNLTDALFICTLFSILMLSVAGGDGLAVGGGMRVKNSKLGSQVGELHFTLSHST